VSDAAQRPSTPPRRHKTKFFGQFLLAEGFITAPQLLAALEYQEQANARLGEYAVALGFITLFDVQRIHALQAEKDKMFGEAAMELGLLSADQLRQVMAAQRSDHVRLGDALSTLGYIGPDDIARALQEFGDQGRQIDPDEWIDLPRDLPSREVVLKVCYLTHKLLPRLWDAANKPGAPTRVTGVLRLSDVNVSFTLRSEHVLTVFLGVPHDIAERAVRWITRNPEPTRQECEEAVRDLLAAIGHHVKVALASEGVSIDVGPTQPCDFTIALHEQSAVMVPFVTHAGQIIVAIGG
jgi:hypothetical protein